MMTENVRPLAKKSVLFLLILLLTFQTACQRPAPPEPPTETAPDERPTGWEATDGYIANQILLAGHPEAVNGIVTNLDFAGSFINPEQPIFQIEIPPDSQIEVPWVREIPEDEKLGFPLVVNLYQLQEGTDVWQLVQDINEFVVGNRSNEDEQSRLDLIKFQPKRAVPANLSQQELAPEEFAIAEPNYETSLPLGGSWVAGSGPDGGSGIGGAPGTTVSVATNNLSKALFTGQWAFAGNNGINLFASTASTQPPERTVSTYTGSGVQVAVFDTTPYPDGRMDIDWALQLFGLEIQQPGLMYGTSGATSAPGAGTVTMAEHGLFVTGLAQGVAPEAGYILYEVLNDEARGDLGELVYALHLYTSDRKSTNSGSLANTVINLSLGLALENDPSIKRDQNAVNAIEASKAVIERAPLPDNMRQDVLEREYPAFGLKAALRSYYLQGSIIVAAAGNEGANTAQTPAGYAEVIGVAASRSDGQPACFSNPGNLAAPGGEAGQPGSTDCVINLSAACPITEPSNNTQGCLEAVISIVSEHASGSRYAYWTGTSFSTPMVSGLAALILQAHPGLSPADVENIIHCSTGSGTGPLPTPSVNINQRLGAGIINVEEALTSCP